MSIHDTESSSRKVDLRTLSHEQLVDLMEQLGYPKFRAKQVEDWVWKHNVSDFQEMTNVPAALRADLSARCTLGGTSEVARQVSSDGSRKYLLRYSDGTQAECVGMPTRNRLAVCVSTQAGCRMGCVFCATGQGGFTRSLKATEIYDQVMHVSEDFQTRASSVVMMGQGEPFNNYDEVIKALRMLNSPEGAGIGRSSPHGIYLRCHPHDSTLLQGARAVHACRLPSLRHSVDQKRDHARRQEVHAAAPPRRHGGVR